MQSQVHVGNEHMVNMTPQIMGKQWIIDDDRKTGSLCGGKFKWLPTLHNI